ncbi:MAG: ClpXP protease specificity-enhancing factor SspB [Rickettsiales bacterium]
MDYLDYSAWIDDSMRLIVKRALEYARDKGLPGEHHFFISFATYHKDVSISPKLRARYPDEMTIVLQHQYANLTVDDAGFSVELSFDGVMEPIRVPFSSVVAFADPGVKFGLQFHQIDAEDDTPAPPKSSKGKERKDAAAAKDGNVVSLDKYRK